MTGLARRDLLRTVGLVGVLLGVGGCTSRQTTFTPSGMVPLPIPPLAPSEMIDGVRRFSLVAQAGESRLITGRPDVVTRTIGYNGPLLGPTLRARRGERIRVRLRNELDETTTLHWHGMELPAVMDGGPHAPIPAGSTATAEWELDQPAATLWYHPHPHGETEQQVLRGLAGLFLIDDDGGEASGLPSRYGVDDIPLILQDRFLDETGQIRRAEGDNALGTVGHTLMANGVSGASFEVTAELVRLRLLNGCAARFLDLRFGDDRGFALVGTDGGLLSEPVELRRLLLSPGERAEILVRLAAGERVSLRTERPEIPGVRNPDVLGEMLAGDFMELQAAARLKPATPWHLPPGGGQPREAEATVTRSFELAMPFLNGRRMDLGRIDAVVRLGDTEIWQVWTADPFPHNFHIHGVQFRVLDVDGASPPAWLGGWKDTVPVFPGQLTRLILRFDRYADDRVPYMMHCHLLQHEDQGMMGQFLVTTDGNGPERIDLSHHSHP